MATQALHNKGKSMKENKHAEITGIADFIEQLMQAAGQSDDPDNPNRPVRIANPNPQKITRVILRNEEIHILTD